MRLPRGVMLLSITPTIDTKPGVCLPMNKKNIMHNSQRYGNKVHNRLTAFSSQRKMLCITNLRLVLNRAL